MKRNVALMIILSLALFMMNCEADKNPSIWDPNEEGAATPTISSVNPPSQQYGGVGERKLVTITGTNFNSEADKNIVYFGKEQADIVEASTTELVVAAPANYGTGLAVQAHVQGAYLPAFYGTEENPTPYELLSAESTVGFYDQYRIPQGVCCDAEGNFFITSNANVDKVSPDGTIQQNYLTIKAKYTSNVKVGPDGALYYTYAKYILKTDTTSGAHTYKGIGFTTVDLDFDADKNLWITGQGQIAVSDYSDFNTVSTAYENAELNFGACRVFNNDLYVVTKYVGADTTISTSPYLGKIAINSDGTVSGDVELIRYLDADGYDNIAVTNITFNTNGDMYLATSNYSLMFVEGDIATAPYQAIYPQILGDYPAYRFAWGIGDETFVNTYDVNDAAKISVKKIMLLMKAHQNTEENNIT